MCYLLLSTVGFFPPIFHVHHQVPHACIFSSAITDRGLWRWACRRACFRQPLGISMCSPVGLGLVFWSILALIPSGVMWEQRAACSVIMLSPWHINGFWLLIRRNDILVSCLVLKMIISLKMLNCFTGLLFIVNITTEWHARSYNNASYFPTKGVFHKYSNINVWATLKDVKLNPAFSNMGVFVYQHICPSVFYTCFIKLRFQWCADPSRLPVFGQVHPWQVTSLSQGQRRETDNPTHAFAPGRNLKSTKSEHADLKTENTPTLESNRDASYCEVRVLTISAQWSAKHVYSVHYKNTLTRLSSYRYVNSESGAWFDQWKIWLITYMSVREI